jgi:TonB family protein
MIELRVSARLVRTLLSAMVTSSILYAIPSLAMPHQPTSRWVVDYAADACLLSRAYGSDEKPLMLSFEKLPMSSDVYVYVFKKTDRVDLNLGKAELRFGGDPKAAQVSFRAATMRKENLRRLMLGADIDLLERAAKSGSVLVDARGEVNEEFAVPNLETAFAALDQCALDLGRAWGIPIDEQNRMKEPARSLEPIGKYFTSSSYPKAALDKDETGLAKVRILIDAAGTPTDCTVVRASGSSSLDATTCRLFMKNIRFKPATDAGGNALRSVYVMSVNWLIGD